MCPSDPRPTRRRRFDPCLSKTLARLPATALAAGLAFGTALQVAYAAEPFKVTNIHFETNASACDMGIQLIFDTDGITEGAVRDPDGRRIYNFISRGGMRAIGGQTEGFLEGIEPQITELLEALGCEPSDEEEEIALDELFAAFPAGDYTFRGVGGGVTFEDQATLTHAIPAGPEILTPADGSVVPDRALRITWNPVTEAVLTANPDLGPVTIVGYHVDRRRDRRGSVAPARHRRPGERDQRPGSGAVPQAEHDLPVRDPGDRSGRQPDHQRGLFLHHRRRCLRSALSDAARGQSVHVRRARRFEGSPLFRRKAVDRERGAQLPRTTRSAATVATRPGGRKVRPAGSPSPPGGICQKYPRAATDPRRSSAGASAG